MTVDRPGRPRCSGDRCYWPAGLEGLTAAERVAALKRGHWPDGDEHIVTRDARRYRSPVEVARIRSGLADLEP